MSLAGQVAEVRVSRTARHGVANFTPSRTFVADVDTLVLWHLDEGSGAIATDASGNGHDGVIEGGTWTQGFCR